MERGGFVDGFVMSGVGNMVSLSVKEDRGCHLE